MRSVLLLLISTALLPAQTYDLLLMGGHVIDPANDINRVTDVAISGDKIARVADGIEPSQAKKVLDVNGAYVTPGLIDLHAHVAGYGGSLFPDDTALLTGTTTVVD
ncbi:MAG: amidohydrolase/deacetylase family metallohydrolase, partial [bacterium]|nr:amidohydrolase/deacetylase family metallohydrolase [bacterium]